MRSARYINRAQPGRRPFVLRSQTLVLLAAGLLALSSPSFAEKAEAAPSPDQVPPTLTQAGLEPTGTGLARTDATSADSTARSSGQRVEVLSQRTDFGRTWALPEGGFESESSGSPVRFPDAKEPDGWSDVDTTLIKSADGTISPKAVPQPVVLGGSGDSANELVTADMSSQSLVFGSGTDATLPPPVLAGSTATYPNVLPGVDVQVEVRSTGFEQLWVARNRAGLDALLSEQAGGDQGVDAALDTNGLIATSQANGSVNFTDSAKKTVSRIPAPVVWDAATAPDGTPAAEIPANLDLVKTGVVVPDKKSVTGDLDLSVAVDEAWLDDPAREYPITIDPTYVAGDDQSPIFDTYVKEGATTDRSDSTYLPVGYGNDDMKNRSFLNFNVDPFRGVTIGTASLSLWADNAGTCTPSGWSAYDSEVATTSSRWTAQPTIGTKYATSTETKGFSSSCSAGRVGIDMKAQLQAWGSSNAPTQGMTLKADSEISISGYHRFWSSDANSNKPVLRWTWDSTTDPDMDSPDIGPSVDPVVDPAAAGVSEDATGDVADPDPSVGEPDCAGSSSTACTASDPAARNDNPKHYYLRIQKAGNGNLNLLLCRSWGKTTCSASSDTGSLYKNGDNSWYKFGWKDTDGVYVPKNWKLMASEAGPDAQIYAAHYASAWVKLSPSALIRDAPTTRKMYIKKI